MNLNSYSAAARLDRLPGSRFHKRLVALVGGGMFCDNFDIYIARSEEHTSELQSLV